MEGVSLNAGEVSGGAAGQGVSGSSGTTEGTTQEEQDKKDEEEKEKEKKRRMCVAIRGGIVVYGSKELASLALHFARGATVAEVFAAGVTAQAGSRVLIGLVAVGGAIYVIDAVSDNAISNAVGDAIGCPK